MANRLRALLALGVALALTTGFPADRVAAQDKVAAPEGATSLIRSDTFNLSAALQRVALKLFPPKDVGVPYQVEMERRVELYREGFELENWVVKRSYSPVGRFTRLKYVADSGSRLDLAFLLRDGRVAQVEALRVPVLEGRPVLDLAACFKPFSQAPAANYAGGLAALFRSMVYLERIATNPASGPKLTEEQGRAMSQEFFDSLPKPEPTCPDFRARTLDGAEVTRASLGAKPFLVFFGTVTDQDSRDMQEAVATFVRASGAGLGFVAVFVDRTEHLDTFLSRGGKLPGPQVVVDAEEELKQAFKIPSVPYVVGYAADGALKLSILHRDAKTTAAELARFRAEVLGKGK